MIYCYKSAFVLLYAGVAEWQTRATQNREGNRGGSSPFTGTIRIKRCYKMADIFLLYLMFGGAIDYGKMRDLQQSYDFWYTGISFSQKIQQNLEAQY